MWTPERSGSTFNERLNHEKLDNESPRQRKNDTCDGVCLRLLSPCNSWRVGQSLWRGLCRCLERDDRVWNRRLLHCAFCAGVIASRPSEPGSRNKLKDFRGARPRIFVRGGGRSVARRLVFVSPTVARLADWLCRRWPSSPVRRTSPPLTVLPEPARLFQGSPR